MNTVSFTDPQTRETIELTITTTNIMVGDVVLSKEGLSKLIIKLEEILE